MRLGKRRNLASFLFLAIAVCCFPKDGCSELYEGNRAKALAHYMIGVIYDLQGETGASIEEFSIAAQYDDNYAIYLRLGADYARLGKLTEAIEQMERVLTIDSQNVQARYLLALIYSTQKDFDKAAEQYEAILTSAAKVDPSNMEIYGVLAQLYYSQRQYDKSIQQFEIILSLDPKNAEMMFLLGSLYLETENRGKAIDLFKRAIAVDPNYDSCLNSLGYLYAEDGIQLDEAQSLIERALALDPDNGAYLDSLGWVYYKKGQYEEALRYLKEADQFLEDPLIREHIGDVYFKLNKREDARKYWQFSLELLPEQSDVQEKLKAIDSDI
jgi:Tfp pilus assembly protein PilF